MFCVIQAAHYIGRGCNVVLCIQNVKYSSSVDTEMVVLIVCHFTASMLAFGQLCSMAVRPGPQTSPIYNGFAEMTVP